MRQSWETMTSDSAGHIILTPTQPVKASVGHYLFIYIPEAIETNGHRSLCETFIIFFLFRKQRISVCIILMNKQYFSLSRFSVHINFSLKY